MGSYAQVSSNVDELIRRRITYPPFPKSVFTTAEVNFCDAPSISRKNWDAVFDSMEAVTSLGTYDHRKGGHIMFLDDDEMVEMPPGTTVLFPAGTKSYNFAAVGKHEQRYLFRQFCSAGVLRWVEKGGRSDKQFDDEAALENQDAWDEMRRHRGQTSLKLFSKLKDIYVC
ncbi:hypothetical protein B0H14DRAFT_2350433 [Mycena olivaceomarginata]|nr:hypothetical protein B0H14DRAFT_2350433 [Mycena olivaceomarginata]